MGWRRIRSVGFHNAVIIRNKNEYHGIEIGDKHYSADFVIFTPLKIHSFVYMM